MQTIFCNRYIFGPLPECVCFIELVFKNSITTQQLLFLDGIILLRYIFIFCLNNPGAFKDEFWNQFISIWVVGFSMISQFVFVFSPPFPNYSYFIQSCHYFSCQPLTHLALKTIFFLHRICYSTSTITDFQVSGKMTF